MVREYLEREYEEEGDGKQTKKGVVIAIIACK